MTNRRRDLKAVLADPEQREALFDGVTEFMRGIADDEPHTIVAPAHEASPELPA